MGSQQPQAPVTRCVLQPRMVTEAESPGGGRRAFVAREADLVAIARSIFFEGELSPGPAGDKRLERADPGSVVGTPRAKGLPMIDYPQGYEPIPRHDWRRSISLPSVHTQIWREGDVGPIAGVIDAAWAWWLSVYPEEWRSVGQAIPYVHLRSAYDCDRPRTHLEEKSDRIEDDHLAELSMDAVAEWENEGWIGPGPTWPAPLSLGHTHAHDHGICLHPWLVYGATDDRALAETLRHELAHAIAGDFGHGDEWLGMCEVIGYQPPGQAAPAIADDVGSGSFQEPP